VTFQLKEDRKKSNCLSNVNLVEPCLMTHGPEFSKKMINMNPGAAKIALLYSSRGLSWL
jgi:hypothetical protein